LIVGAFGLVVQGFRQILLDLGAAEGDAVLLGLPLLFGAGLVLAELAQVDDLALMALDSYEKGRQSLPFKSLLLAEGVE